MSTRQMCSGGGTSASEGVSPFGGAGSGSASGTGMASGSAVSSGSGTGVQEPPESTANRSSVLRRTTSYQGNQAHSSYRVVSAGSLAESASAVTRLHSYTMQMQRQRPPTATTTTTTSAPSLYDLPNELIEKILSYVDYKKVSNLRLVSALLPLCSTQSAGIKSIKSNLPKCKRGTTGLSNQQTTCTCMPLLICIRCILPLCCYEHYFAPCVALSLTDFGFPLAGGN